MIVLGIDPGSRHTGYGVIRWTKGRGECVLEYGVLHLDGQDSHPLRLKHIYDRVLAVIDRTHPDECAIEMPVYGRNAQSMLKLGRAQAAAMLAAMNREVPVTQYTPKEVKKAVTGNGNASKRQIWYMVEQLLKVEENRGFDAADALAVALCHLHRITRGVTRKYKNWSSFIEAHPDRIIR